MRNPGTWDNFWHFSLEEVENQCVGRSSNSQFSGITVVSSPNTGGSPAEAGWGGAAGARGVDRRGQQQLWAGLAGGSPLEAAIFSRP